MDGKKQQNKDNMTHRPDQMVGQEENSQYVMEVVDSLP